MFLDSRRLWCLCRVSGGFLDSFRCASPHETPTFVIDHRVNVENFIFQVVEVVVIEVEASFESTIGHSSLPFQECDDLGRGCRRMSWLNPHSAGVSSLIPSKMTYFHCEAQSVS